MRGQPCPRVRQTHDGRIIPARAGPTNGVSVAMMVRPDHPRSCGANRHHRRRRSRPRGSSPLVRGQHVCIKKHKIDGRIIPARAGPTERCRAMPGDWTDHPRSCGANLVCRSLTQCRSGSSPLVRGQLSHGGHVLGEVRIIPARAGPTTPCAENIGYQDGSSPLVRGQREPRGPSQS